MDCIYVLSWGAASCNRNPRLRGEAKTNQQVCRSLILNILASQRRSPKNPFLLLHSGHSLRGDEIHHSITDSLTGIVEVIVSHISVPVTDMTSPRHFGSSRRGTSKITSRILKYAHVGTISSVVGPARCSPSHWGLMPK